MTKTYRFYFAPEGRQIDVITINKGKNAEDMLKKAKRIFFMDNPQYKAAKGEIYWKIE